MPRTGPSAADRELIAAAARAGHHVSLAQLERWRSIGHVPRNERTGLGRGRGTSSRVPDGALEKVIWCATQARQGRALPYSDVLGRASLGMPTPPGEVKAIMLAEYDRIIALLAGDPHPFMDDDLAGDLRHDAAHAAVKGIDPGAGRGLIEYITTGVEPELPPTKKMREALAVMLQGAASGGEDMAYEDIFDAMKLLGHVPLAADVRLDGNGHATDIDELEASLRPTSLANLREQLKAFSEDEMCRALRAVATATGFQMTVILFALPAIAGAEQVFPPELAHLERAAMPALRAITDDPMWPVWGQFNYTLTSKPKLQAQQRALAAASALLTDMVDDIESYAQRLHLLVYPDGPAIV